MLAEEVDFVIGVDTHRDAHVWAVVVADTGAIIAEGSVSADTRGYRQALAIVEDRAPGCRVWAVEGTGSYGAGLARYLADHGERLIEVERLVRAGDRARLKSDSLDAVRAARSTLGLTKLATPRQRGPRESLRALQTTREGAIAARTQALNQLRALVVVCPEPLRSELRVLSQARLIARCTRLRLNAHTGDEQRGTLIALRMLARRLLVLTNEAKELEHEIHTLVTELAPQLLNEPGVGPISAAQLLISWSHPGRLRSEAAFAPPRRRRPHPRLLRPDHPLPPRPGRRPQTQPRPANDHPHPPPAAPGHDRLHRTPPSRRQDQPRKRPLPEALPRPPPLPTTRGSTYDYLTRHRSIP